MKYPALLILFLISCQSKNTTEETRDSLVAEEAPPENIMYNSRETPGGFSESSTFNLPAAIEDFDTFIDAGTSIYTGASSESEVIKELTDFTPATEIQRTSSREPEDIDVCQPLCMV